MWDAHMEVGWGSNWKLWFQAKCYHFLVRPVRIGYWLKIILSYQLLMHKFMMNQNSIHQFLQSIFPSRV